MHVLTVHHLAQSIVFVRGNYYLLYKAAAYSTLCAIAGNFQVKMSRTYLQLLSFSVIGMKIWICIPSELRQLRKHTLNVT